MAIKVVIAVVVLLLLAAGGGGYFFFAGGEEEPETVVPVEVARPAFYALDPITLPAIRADGVGRLVGFRIVLELAPGRGAPEISPRRPRLEDAVVTELASLLAVDWPGGKAIDLDIAKARLLRESDRVLGPGLVVEVLFEQIQIRDI